ncbi:TIGR03663 family protein, partial [bacterium]|nr:TIGR03663 family protein [bacterium]
MSTDFAKKIYLVIILIIILTSFFLRIYHLANRPFHHDEGVNSSFLLALIKDSTYNYNPENFHGPLLYYLSYIPISIFGLKTSLIQVDNPELADVSFRLAPAFFGLMIVVLMLSLSSWLERYGTIAAMILTALSPSYLFYSRYNIHEIYLITFTLLAFISGYHFWKSGKNIFIYMSFISLALIFTLKETAIITLAIWAISLCTTSIIHYLLNNEKKISDAGKELWNKIIKKIINPIPIAGIVITIFTTYMVFSSHGKLAEKAEISWFFALVTKGVSFLTIFLLASFFFAKLRNKTKQILLGSIVFFIIISIFFSSLFTYSKGIASFFIAFEKWMSTGTVESQHTKTFFYYLKIMLEFESPILFLSLLGMIFSMQQKDPVMIFTTVWAILAFIINSAIPYKTP